MAIFNVPTVNGNRVCLYHARGIGWRMERTVPLQERTTLIRTRRCNNLATFGSVWTEKVRVSAAVAAGYLRRDARVHHGEPSGT
jgi:hypothetical protein